MKKIATLLLAAGLLFSAAGMAQAIDFKIRGQWIMAFDYGEHGAFTGGNGDFVTLFEPTATEVAQAGKGYILASIGQESGEIARIMRLARLDMAQLHAGQSVECARRLGPERVIRVLWPQRYGDAAALEAAAGQYADSCALYLLDAGRTGGGSGRTLAWEDLEDLRLPHPWLLAGGMSPANLRQALARCRPDGVDCNSGVEDAPGRKNARAMTDMARLAGRS